MKKINKDQLIQMISQEEESNHLDFKKEFHENNASLIHDILCLSNAKAESDRFLIFGISNKKEIIGVDPTTRKNQAAISDLLRSANINRMIEFLFYSIELDTSCIDILHIKNSNLKPYFLLKDKIIGTYTIRAGVIYSRYNDTNTPKNGTITDTEMSEIWMERFGLLRTPYERALNYVRNLAEWKSSDVNECYYEPFPEFRLLWSSEEFRDRFSERWVDKEHPCDLANTEIKLLYHNTLLKKFNAINLEDRSIFPTPHYYNLKNSSSAFINGDTLDIYVCAIISNSEGNIEFKDFITKNSKEILGIYLESLKLNLTIYSLDISVE